jgi:hypothetical protein
MFVKPPGVVDVTFQSSTPHQIIITYMTKFNLGTCSTEVFSPSFPLCTTPATLCSFSLP